MECEDDPLGSCLNIWTDWDNTITKNDSKILKSYTSVMEPFAKHIVEALGSSPVEALLKSFAISDVYYSHLDRRVK